MDYLTIKRIFVYKQFFLHKGEYFMRTVHLGCGGPVRTGKTTLIKMLVEQLKKEFHVGVITNDIYTQEDANYLIGEKIFEQRFIRCL